MKFPEEFDLTLDNGRLLEHFHEGNLTNKSEGIQYKFPEVFVEISPELAKERGVLDGTLVRLESPYGAIKLRVVVTDRMEGHNIYVPMHSASHESAVNLLTGGSFDVQTNTPAYKQIKVRMQILQLEGKKIRFLNTIRATPNGHRKWAWKFSANGAGPITTLSRIRMNISNPAPVKEGTNRG